MVKVTVNNNEVYECDRAVKGIDYIHLYNNNGNIIASFEGIMDFNGFSIENGEWENSTPTQEERLTAVENMITALLDL